MRPDPLPNHARRNTVLTTLLLAALGLAPATAFLPRAASARTGAGADGSPDTSLAGRLDPLGLENVQLDTASSPPRLTYENRRYRHTAEVAGRIERAAGARVGLFERRLGLVSAAIDVEGTTAEPRFRVRFPSDGDFPAPPTGPVRDRTSRGPDLLLGALFGYELGRLTQPLQLQLQIEPMLRYNPWPGARATVSMLIPVYNDFLPTKEHPDIEEVRPSLVTLEQYAWIPRVALASGTVGIFDDNRYGFSLGAARPMADGRLLLDSQLDVTGFIAFPPEGLSYSDISQVSAFGGLTWFVPRLDAAVRLRAGQFLYGDRGTQIELRRSFGDLDFSLFGYRGENGLSDEGVRVSLPVPPMARPTRLPIRALPIERFPVNYHTEADPVGRLVTGIASREEFLRQLGAASLESNSYRYRRGLDGLSGRPPGPSPEVWVNASGMTGFIFTPWADVIPDRTISVDFTHVPGRWSYSGRGQYTNEAWSMTLGLLPRVEASLRFTRLPGAKGFKPDDPDNQISTDTDHMASGRLALLTPGKNRPGLAVGVEDVEGTRRFHSTYAVTGMPLEISGVHSRLSMGYAFSVFTAARHVLDGGFGALEISPWRAVATRIEYDSEKWNVGVGVELPFGLRLRAAALNLETLSAGAGWVHGL